MTSPANYALRGQQVITKTKMQSRGGIAFGDVSQGLDHTDYTATYVDSDILINGTLLFTKEGVLNFDLAFDKNGYPVVVYSTLGGVYVYYYDTAESEYSTKLVRGVGRNPWACLDTREPSLLANSDVILTYEYKGYVYFSVSSDDYSSSTYTGISIATSSIFNAGMNSDNTRHTVILQHGVTEEPEPDSVLVEDHPELTVYYRFDTLQDSVAVDSSISENHGNVAGGVLANGWSGKLLNFENNPASGAVPVTYVSLGTAMVLQDNFTISVKFKDTVGKASNVLCGGIGDSLLRDSISIKKVADRFKLDFLINNGAEQSLSVDIGAYDNEFHTLVFSVIEGDAYVYFDDVKTLVGENFTLPFTVEYVGTFSMDSQTDHSRQHYDNFRVFNRYLTDQEATVIHNEVSTFPDVVRTVIEMETRMRAVTSDFVFTTVHLPEDLTAETVEVDIVMTTEMDAITSDFVFTTVHLPEDLVAETVETSITMTTEMDAMTADFVLTTVHLPEDLVAETVETSITMTTEMGAITSDFVFTTV